MKKILHHIIWFVVAAPLIFLAITWNKIPATVPLHFDLQGNADRFGSKKEMIILVLVLMVINILVYLLLTNLYRIDPRKYANENRDKLSRMAFAVASFISAIICVLVYSSMSGNFNPQAGIIFSATGLLFAVIGNYMLNIKPNYFAGFRVSWTLNDPQNWKKTHLLAGRLWFAGGLVIAVVCLFLEKFPALIFFVAILVIITVIPLVYSYQLHKQQKRSGQAT